MTAALTALAAVAPATGSAATVSSGSASARVNDSTGHFDLLRNGRPLLRESTRRGTGATGALGFRAGGVWRRATRVFSSGGSTRNGRSTGFFVELATTDPAGRRLFVTVAPSGRGAIGLRARVTGGSTADVTAVGMAFAAPAGERHLGFGERSNRVNQRGATIQNYVGEGVYDPGDYAAVAANIPPWGIRRRGDATYFPMPWLLSTRGYGVLADNTEESVFRLGSDRRDAWSVEVLATEHAAALHRRPLTRERGPRPDRADRAPAAAGGSVDARPVVPDRPLQHRARRAGVRGPAAPRRRPGVRRGDAHALHAVRRGPRQRGRRARPHGPLSPQRTGRAHLPPRGGVRHLHRAVLRGRAQPPVHQARRRQPLHLQRLRGRPHDRHRADRLRRRGRRGVPRQAAAPRRDQRLRRLDGGLRRVHPARLGLLQRPRRAPLPQPLSGALPPLRPALRRQAAAPDRPLHSLRLDRGPPLDADRVGRRPQHGLRASTACARR